MKKIKKLSLFLPVFVSSCFTSAPVIKTEKVINNTKTQINQVYLGKVKVGGEIKLEIKSLGFKAKAYNDAIFPKTFVDIKSFKIFLTTNFNDPLDPASMVTPILWFNKDINNTVVKINDVPDGKNYYGVISAYDDVANSTSANNITEPDPSIQSIDKKWSRTINKVDMISGFDVYSDNSGSLKVSLQLKYGVQAAVDTGIKLLPGNPLPPGGEQIN